MEKPKIIAWSTKRGPGSSVVRRRRAFVAILLLSVVLISVARWVTQPVSSGSATDKVIHVAKGSTTRQIASLLERERLIRSQWVFLAMLSSQGKTGQLQAGDYLLNSSMRLQAIIDQMVAGDVYRPTRKLTIPEGKTVEQIAELVAQSNLVSRDHFLAAVEQIGGKDLASGVRWGLEGYLFPATYEIPEGSSAIEIVETLHQQALDRYRKIQLPKGHPLDLAQVITLASVVEREAMHAEERPIIAAIFLNRLQSEWKLESCATVQYVLGVQKPILSLEDIAIDSPYNTYRLTGLPPGPIGSPGLASIEAVLNPAQTDYLFFVAGSDGHHLFSRTFEEHLQAVARVQGDQ